MHNPKLEILGYDKNIWHIDEPESKLLTVEFLCTLQTTDSKVTFRLFGKYFSVLSRQFIELLGFKAQCVVHIDSALRDYDRVKFWRKFPKNPIVTIVQQTTFITQPCVSYISG